MGREATLYLTSRGVRVTGTDGWSWDAPFVHTARRYAETKDASIIWEGHKAGREIGYCHIEKLHNLEVAAGDRVSGRVLSGQDPPRIGRLDAGRRHIERVTACRPLFRLPRRRDRVERVDETGAEVAVAALGPEALGGLHQNLADVRRA